MPLQSLPITASRALPIQSHPANPSVSNPRIASPAVPCLSLQRQSEQRRVFPVPAYPAIPCLAMRSRVSPIRTSPGLFATLHASRATHVAAQPNLPETNHVHASRAKGRVASPRQSSPGSASPIQPGHALPLPSKPRHAKPILASRSDPCRASPFLARLRHDATRLPLAVSSFPDSPWRACRSMPRLAANRRAVPLLAAPAVPSAIYDDAATAFDFLALADVFSVPISRSALPRLATSVLNHWNISWLSWS